MSPSSARIGTRPGVSYTRLHRRWPRQLELIGTGALSGSLLTCQWNSAESKPGPATFWRSRELKAGSDPDPNNPR